MFKLGLTEILLFLVIFFIIDPTGFPKIFRKIGKSFASIREFSSQLRDLTADAAGSGKKKSSKEKNKFEDEFNEEQIFEIEYEKEIRKSLKLLSLDALSKNFDFSSTEAVLRMLFDSLPEVRAKAFEVLSFDPVFSFEKRIQSGVIPHHNYVSPIEQMFSKDRIDNFSEIVSVIPQKYFHGSLAYLARYPGIDNLNINKIFTGSKRQYYDTFRKYQKDALLERYPPQITISPSYECNMSCSYCFLNNARHKFPDNMDLQNFRNILDRIDSENTIKRISLFGGEPTLFRELNTFIDEIENRKLYFYFATNGIADPHLFSGILDRPSLESVTFHVEEDDFYDNKQLEMLLCNIRETVKKKVKPILRYNISNPESRSWEFLDKYFDMIPELYFTFSLVFPSRCHSNKFIDLKDFENYKSRILSLIKYFTKKKYSEKSKLVFAKPYPLCFFNKEELYYVLNNSIVKNLCEIDRNGGTNNILIHPDGSYSPCMALVSDDYNFPSVDRFDRLPSQYYAKIVNLQRIPIMNRCRDCSLHSMGLCQAACYAYV